VTQKLADETKAQFEGADAGRQEAAAQLEAAKASVSEADAQLEKSRADVEEAKARAQLALADEQRLASLVEYCTVRAPFDGVISQRNTNVGNFVPAGSPDKATPVFTLVQTNVVRVFVDVPEMDAAGVDVGDRATIFIEALPEQKLTASVTRTSWALNQTARTLRTEIDIPNESGRMRPGMYVTVTVVLDERENALTLPIKAIATDGGQSFCWVVAAGRGKRTPVQIGLKNATECEIISGLTGDEEVIDAGLSSLQDGQTVAKAP
jgi:RND family efflux transporter MFP subunit